MKLVIDCFKLIKGTGKSIGIYNLTKNLVQNLADNKKKEDSIIVLGTNYNRDDFSIPGVKFVAVKYNPKNKLVCIFWELYLVTIALKKIGADKVLFPRGFAPLVHPTKDYIIVHDMIPFYYHKNFPDVLNRFENAYIMWRLKASIKTSAKVITVSESSKKDIMDITGVKGDKIKVILSGQNAISGVKARTESLSYICAVTSGLPHKNAEGIVKSYEIYRKKQEEPLALVLIGLENTDTFDVCEETKKNITCYKFLEKDEDMYQIVADSSVFLFLSLIEGFGFPPLEAMQLGVPVICSDTSSIPEVVGDAAVLVSPTDYEAVADKLVLLTRDRNLRENYIRRGYENAKRFLWENRIQEYVEELF